MFDFFHAPLQLLGMLARQATLPVHELTRAYVNQVNPRQHIRPFNDPDGFTGDPNYPTERGKLNVGLWRLFHATKKAELLQFRPWGRIFWSAAGSLLEHAELFAPTRNLRLNPGMAHLYGDFSATGLAGRLSQGLAFLFMEERGYSFGERLESLLARSQGQAGYAPDYRPRQNTQRQGGEAQETPDFIFEMAQPPNETALVEAKGSFVSPGAALPDIKGRLREGLQQLEGWDQLLNPAPAKGFVVGGFIREDGDGHAEPSMLCFVDPAGKGATKTSWEYPRDYIRRANYAAWLRGMGFLDSAADLLARRVRATLKPYRLPIAEIGGRQFALAVPTVPEPLWHLPELLLTGPIVMGLEIRVLQALSDALMQPDGDSLMSLELLPQIEPEHDGSTVGSSLSDGSFFGHVHPKQILSNAKEFKL